MDRLDSELSENDLGDGLKAVGIDRPDSIGALQDAVRARSASGQAMFAQGGRTSLDYGGIPRCAGAIIDTRKLNRVIEYPAADMTITVETGMTLAAIAKVLDAENQRLEIDAPQADRATIGGVYATNSTGPRRYGSGRPRDQIIGVGFVTSDGNVVKGGGRVVKNVAGYDFPKLITGSMGTLGVISHVTVKVRPKPEASALMVFAYDDLNVVASDLAILNTSVTRPVAIELINGPALTRLGLPHSAWAIALIFDDNEASVAWQMQAIRSELAGKVVRDERDQASAPLQGALREFTAERIGPISFVANVPYSFVATLAMSVDSAVWAIQSHAGNGVVRAHALVDDLARLEADVVKLRDLTESVGGNMILSLCPTDRKASLKVWGNPRGDWAWSEKVKAALDPAALMNPGRFVGNI